MRLLADADRGAWLLERIGDQATVGGVAGVGFAACARVLHPVPATRVDRTVADEWGMHPVLEETRWSWSRVAQRQGLTTHPLVQWNRLADIHQGVEFDDGWRVGQTQEGYLDLDLLAALTEHLARATTTPEELVAGIWNGWGELSGHGWSVYIEQGRGPRAWLARRLGQGAAPPRRVPVAPEVQRAALHGPWLEWPDREMVLFATSTAELADPTWVAHAGVGVQPSGSGLGPQLLWPADHSWVVASEIDWDSTIVAGSRSLVDAVLSDERFEAFEVGEDDDLTYESDTINPPRAG